MLITKGIKQAFYFPALNFAWASHQEFKKGVLMPKKLDALIESAEARQRIVDELLKRRNELLGKEIEIDNRYPKQSATYRGRLEDIQVRQDKLFLVLEEKPGEFHPHLVGSRDEKFAKDIAKHIPKTRLHTIE